MCNRNTARPPPFHPVTGTTTSSLLKVHTHDRPNAQTHQFLSIMSFILAWVLFGKGKSLFSHFLEVFTGGHGEKADGKGPCRYVGVLLQRTLRNLEACLAVRLSWAKVSDHNWRTQAGLPTWPMTREMGSGHKPGAGSLETQTRPLRDNRVGGWRFEVCGTKERTQSLRV